MSKLLSSLFKKSDLSDSLVIQAKLPVFTAFPPFYTQELIAPVALPPIALFKRVMGAICSHHPLQKSDHK